MSRFHQRLREDLRNPEFATAFHDMSIDIVLLQVLEQTRKSLRHITFHMLYYRGTTIPEIPNNET